MSVKYNSDPSKAKMSTSASCDFCGKKLPVYGDDRAFIYYQENHDDKGGSWDLCNKCLYKHVDKLQHQAERYQESLLVVAEEPTVETPGVSSSPEKG
jgi:hypothetical protein